MYERIIYLSSHNVLLCTSSDCLCAYMTSQNDIVLGSYKTLDSRQQFWWKKEHYAHATRLHWTQTGDTQWPGLTHGYFLQVHGLCP